MEWIYPDTITITRINNHAGWSDPGSLGFLRCSHDFESTLEAVLVAGVIRTVLEASERAATWSEREAVLEASERAAGTEQGALFVGGIDVTANNPKLFSF